MAHFIPQINLLNNFRYVGVFISAKQIESWIEFTQTLALTVIPIIRTRLTYISFKITAIEINLPCTCIYLMK